MLNMETQSYSILFCVYMITGKGEKRGEMRRPDMLNVEKSGKMML